MNLSKIAVKQFAKLPSRNFSACTSSLALHSRLVGFYSQLDKPLKLIAVPQQSCIEKVSGANAKCCNQESVHQFQDVPYLARLFLHQSHS
mmetsp:Transcript_14210/g.17241  ORF Transcript_14210/g.17241 Transcript_14210/m.17241 type:complete len:90 (-) Transcript_14210:1053-1322(-)